MAECQNIMHIFKILMTVPFTNAIITKCLFSQMNNVKTDFCNRLSRSRLYMCLHFREQGLSIKDFKSDHLIDHLWTEKERHLKSSLQLNRIHIKGPRLNLTEYVKLSTLTMSDFEKSDDEECFSL